MGYFYSYQITTLGLRSKMTPQHAGQLVLAPRQQPSQSFRDDQVSAEISPCALDFSCETIRFQVGTFKKMRFHVFLLSMPLCGLQLLLCHCPKEDTWPS